MDDGEAEGTPLDDPVVAALTLRRTRALEGWERLNRGTPQSEAGYQPLPGFQMQAQLDALVSILAEAGQLDLHQFMIEMLLRQCVSLEEGLAAAAEHKRNKTGVIIPGVTSMPRNGGPG